MQHRKTITDRHKRLGNDYDMTILYHREQMGRRSSLAVFLSVPYIKYIAPLLNCLHLIRTHLKVMIVTVASQWPDELQTLDLFSTSGANGAAGRVAQREDLLVFRFKGLVIGADVTGCMLRYRICMHSCRGRRGGDKEKLMSRLVNHVTQKKPSIQAQSFMNHTRQASTYSQNKDFELQGPRSTAKP